MEAVIHIRKFFWALEIIFFTFPVIYIEGFFLFVCLLSVI